MVVSVSNSLEALPHFLHFLKPDSSVYTNPLRGVSFAQRKIHLPWHKSIIGSFTGCFDICIDGWIELGVLWNIWCRWPDGPYPYQKKKKKPIPTFKYMLNKESLWKEIWAAIQE